VTGLISAPLLTFILVFVLWLISSIKILNEYERGVIFRLGRLLASAKGPGIIFVLFPIDRMVRVSLRTVVHDVPPQDVITRDNVSVKVNAVIYYRVLEPRKAVVEVEQYHYATSQLAQTTLRSVLGQAELDDLLSERERLNAELQQILDKHTDPWGGKVSAAKSSISTGRPKCSAPWPNRRRRSARNVRRSSTRRGRCRPPSSSPWRPIRFPRTR